MKLFKIIFTVLLSSQAAYSQNAIVITNSNGKTKTSVPVQDGQSPSVVVSQASGGGLFIATGPAAQILANRQSQTPVRERTENSETIIFPVYDGEGQYVGSVSKLAENIYVTAAHVMTEVQSERAVAISLNMSLSDFKMFQPEVMGRALDVIFISTLSETDLQKALISVLQVSENELPSSQNYFVNYLSMLDQRIVRFESQGVWSSALDQKTIYLRSLSSNLITWGSSGSLVFGHNENQQARLIGIVQCAVKVEVATSQDEKSVDYFRAVSVKSILNSVVKPVDLQTLRERSADYDLTHCDPVSGKKGGGG